ncbi:phosphatase PAP2 family protein [candidate division WOR-3 bacterium]|nr:phosphatase PAP2 family protein [candidate division WOR-3 bacterium]
MNFLPFGIDLTLLEVLNRYLHSVPLDYTFCFFSDERSSLIPIFLSLVFFLKKYREKGAILFVFALLAVGLSDFLGAEIFKTLFSRPRPCQEIGGLFYFDKDSSQWLVTDGIKNFKSSSSFVSNHASNSFAFSLFSSFYFKKLAPFYILAALLVGVSRIYTGVHYPSDVIAGFSLGALCAFFSKWALESLQKTGFLKVCPLIFKKR